MTTHPLIASALSETEQRFIAFVEQHARARDLPNERIRVWAGASLADDSYQALHSVIVVSNGEGVWRIKHSLKRTEALQGRATQLETRFEVTGPGIPDAYGRRVDIEELVAAALDAATDSGRS